MLIQVCLPPIRNLLKTTFVPVGFWSRLMSRLFADASIELLAKEGCGITKENEGKDAINSYVYYIVDYLQPLHLH